MSPDAAAPGSPLAGLGAAGEADRLSPLDSVGGAAALFDSSLPTLVFIGVFALDGAALAPALWAAGGAGVAIAAWRLLRRERAQNAFAGLVGLAVAAFIASRTGEARDVLLPGLVINAAYALAYLVSILLRWPLLGVAVSLVRGEGMAWRTDPVLLRAFTLASWLWVGMFGLRLLVQVPLYLADAVVALGVARLAMGWPLFLLCLWLSWLVLRNAYRVRAADAGG